MTRLFLPALLIATLACYRPASAQPVPTLGNVAPAYLKQGESLELTITGGNLADVSSVALPNPRGLTADLLKPEKPDPAKARVKLTAAADAPLGVRELRLITPLGVTAPLPVTVGQYPAVMDKEPGKEPGSSADQAQALELPASLSGKIEPAGDVDQYRFDAKKGQKLVFDIHAQRFASQLDPVLTIYDAAGREQTRSLSFHGGDPLAVFEAPEDGSYVLEVRDLQFRGGGNYAYRIDAGQIPYVESILPTSGERGKVVEVKAVGHNLDGGETITLDLTNAKPGPMPVRAKTSLGLSNEVNFTVSDTGAAAEKEPNDKADKATPVGLPTTISGTLEKAGDEDFFKFNVAGKQSVTIEVQARRVGSPVDALLTLKNAKGDAIETTNGTADAEARIARDLEPGDYVVSLRDLTFAGGQDYAYRLNVFQSGGVPPDFAVRFMPDVARVSKGSHAKLWCEVTRINGYKGDVTVSLEDLPAGVTVSNGPVVIGESTSGVFTVSAAPDAAVGSFPIRLKAVGNVGATQNTRYGEAELSGRVVQAAYLTVLEKTPFTVEAVALLKPEQLQAYAGEVAQLTKKLEAATPELAKAQAEWEKQATAAVEWKTLDPVTIASAGGATLAKQPDGSILYTGGQNPERDTYTVVADTDLKGITAIRLEALTHDSLPQKGPGRKDVNGNFVLNTFKVTAGPKAEGDKPADPAKAKPVALVNPRATFEQGGYGIAGALDDKPESGWAIFGGTGKEQTAVFFTKSPLGSDSGPTALTFTLDQQYGEQHVLGRFRLSVTTDPKAAEKAGGPQVPEPVLAILKTPADKRNDPQKAQIASYYRTISPELKADRAKLEALRSGTGPYAEIARLEGLLNNQTKDLDNERDIWEQTVLEKGAGWTLFEVTGATAANGTALTREQDGSFTAGGNSPSNDAYTLVGNTPLKVVTAVRIEALPDERYPGLGPGRGQGGNFILSRFELGAAPRGKPGDKPATLEPVDLASPEASFEQRGWSAVGALDDRNDTGWGIAPQFGRPASVVFRAKSPVGGGEGGLSLRFILEHNAPTPQHTLGRFRIWVTGSADAGAQPAIPDDVREALKTSANRRDDIQSALVNNFYRSISPTLEPVRQRLAELKSRTSPVPLVVARGRQAFIPVPVRRADDFKGDVTVTLEGFSSGRDPATRMPTPTLKNLVAPPLAIKTDDAFGRLTFRVSGNSETGARMVVLKAESKIGNDTYVQYSPAFPLTVTEK